ncbi:MAG: IS200/IS605 family transposase [bacterium]
MPACTHVFSEVYLHLNWHCHKNAPMIRPEIESPIYEFIEQYCRKLKGIHFKGVGGTEDHVHLVFQIEPFVLLSDFVGKIKGATSHEMNVRFGADTLKWQRGYGIVSFSKKHLSAVLRYVENQEEHHRHGTINNALEVCVEHTEERVE